MSFGMMEAMLSFLRRQIGLRTDAADSAGSLHAKVKDLKDNGIVSIDNKLGTSSDTRTSNTVMGWLNTQIKSIQRGITTVNTTANVTISSVNTSKSFVVAHGRAGGNGTNWAYGGGITARLTSSTNLELISGFSSGDYASSAVVSWEVVEFY